MGPRLLSQFLTGSPQRSCGLDLLKSGALVQKDGATKLIESLRLHLGKDTQQDVSEHYKRFLYRSSRLYQQSMQHYIAEEAALHEKALLAVRSVAQESGEVKEIISTVLRGYLLLENASLTGTEQVVVFGTAGRRYEYTAISRALRETWGQRRKTPWP